MINMIAVRPLTYRTRRLMPGDRFDARGEIAARLLMRKGKARVAEPRQPPQPVKPLPQIPSIEGDDLAVLRALAKSLGIETDGRWGVNRLKSEIAKKR